MSGSSRYMDEIKDLDLIHIPKIKMPDCSRELVIKYFSGDIRTKALEKSMVYPESGSGSL